MVENTPAISHDKLLKADPRFEVLDGVDVEGGLAQGSYHHAAGLHRALENVKTRFVLICDPDFFIITSEWIDLVLNYMRRNDLHFFGAPYFPTHHTKYRYFPTVTCLFIDLTKVKEDELDFTPEMRDAEYVRGLGWGALLRWVLLPKPPPIGNLFASYAARSLIMSEIKRRFFTIAPLTARIGYAGYSRDTGYRFYRFFASRKTIAYECLIPSYENPLFSSPTSYSDILKYHLVARIVPEAFSPYPKKRSYTTSLRFNSFGLPDCNSHSWEEFFFRDQPFGFHLRAPFQGKKAIDYEQLNDILRQFLTVQTSPSRKRLITV